MDNTPLEKEVKFYITDLVALKNRLISLEPIWFSRVLTK